MRIGIDLRPLQGETQYRGIGKSLEFFLETISEIKNAKNSYVLYIDETLATPQITKRFPVSRIIHIKGSPLGRMRYVRSVLPSYTPIHPSRKDIDVLLQYDASLGIPKSIPTYVVFHDLIPFLFRGKEKKIHATGMRKYKNKLAGTLYWKKYLRVLNTYKNAAHIIAISEASKRDLLKYVHGVDVSKISVIPHGVRPLKDNGAASKSIKILTASPYLLYVGGIDLRKNVVELLRTLYSLKPKHPNLKLITVGKEFELESQLEDLGWSKLLRDNPEYINDVIQPGFLSENDLAFLYSHATAFVFPSHYEGFGMPILEAMSAGCPVVAYANSSIPEVAGKAAVLLNHNDSFKDAVERLLNDGSFREKLIEAGKKQVKLFTWEKTAKRILHTLEAHQS